VVFSPTERPWVINFFGSISALESEKQRTRADSMNAGMLLVQSMQMMKEMGASKEIMGEFLTKTMMLDEDQAKLFATIVDAKPPQDGGGFGGE
jgi:glutaminase